MERFIPKDKKIVYMPFPSLISMNILYCYQGGVIFTERIHKEDKKMDNCYF